MESKELIGSIIEELSRTKLGDLSVDIEALDVVFSLKGKDLSTLLPTKISEHIYTIATYVAYLQMEYNVQQVQYITAKNKYETSLDEAMATSQLDKKITAKERQALVLKDNPHLRELREEMHSAQRTSMMLNHLPDRLLEIANSLKKELALRGVK